MGSSGHDYAGNRPDIPAPSGQLNPTPQQAYAPPPGSMPPSFLPSDPHAMATGLTRAMLADQGPGTSAPPRAGPTGGADPAAQGGPGGNIVMPDAVRQMPPELQIQWLVAMQNGDKAAADKMALAYTINQARTRPERVGGGDRSGYTTSGSSGVMGGPSSASRGGLA